MPRVRSHFERIDRIRQENDALRSSLAGLGAEHADTRERLTPERGPKEVQRENDALRSDLSSVRNELARVQATLNLGLFRVEAKKDDERTAFFSGNGLRVSVRPQEQYPFTVFRVERDDGAVFEENLQYSHLALGRLLSEYRFRTVLEIGSRSGTAARALGFAGKNVHTVEILDSYEAEYSGDYLDARIKEPVDAIWCSHVLEHQRYLGRFLEKMFDDLKEDGVLAVTVPSALSPLLVGHCNIFTPLHLVYNLVLAGFDCSDARVKCYDWQFSVLVRKRPNNIPRISLASEHHASTASTLGFVPNLFEFFPREVQDKFQPHGAIWGEVEALNW